MTEQKIYSIPDYKLDTDIPTEFSDWQNSFHPITSIEKEQIRLEAWKAAVAWARQDERERCINAVNDEQQYPGDMPDEMFEALTKDKDLLSEALRRTVKLTQAGIIERIRRGGIGVEDPYHDEWMESSGKYEGD